jgi:L-lactate dehydrogenase complex protein LldG
MSGSREAILARVRANRPPSVDCPSLAQPWVKYDDPLAQFADTVKMIGGVVHAVANREAAQLQLSQMPYYRDDLPQVSLVPGVGRSTVELDSTEAPHQLATLELAVLPGELAVAENGAVWVTDRSCRHRAVYFLCEHLVLVVPRQAIVHNMHQAYERLGGFGREEAPPFATMIAGPSKTADIEQSLVIGAQGPRSMMVLLLEDA